jgi:nucleoside-diphosphate-sugar epimerase
VSQQVDKSHFQVLASKKVFVTGSCGYIGAELTRDLHDNDITVFGADRLARGDEQLDLCDANGIDPVLGPIRSAKPGRVPNE